MKTILDRYKRSEDEYVAPVFEEICYNYVSESMGYSNTERWWYKEDEIDIVGLNERENKILFGECKWSKNKVDFTLLNDLKEKAKEVRWKNEEREENYALFSKTGFTDDLKEQEEKSDMLELYSLEEMKDIFDPSL